MLTSSSVVLPRAESTATTRLPASLAATIFSAARLTRSASATDVPPNFMTTVCAMFESASGMAFKDGLASDAPAALGSHAAPHPVAARNRASPRARGRGGRRRRRARARWRVLEGAERLRAGAEARRALVPVARDPAAGGRAAGHRHPEADRAPRAVAAPEPEGRADAARRVPGHLGAGAGVDRPRDGRGRHGA